MASLKSSRFWASSFGLTKRLDFIRPFLAMASLKSSRLWASSFGLTKRLNFIRPFLAMASLKSSRLWRCSSGLTKRFVYYYIWLSCKIAVCRLPQGGRLFSLRTLLAEVRQSPIYNKEWERGGRRGLRKKIRHFVHFPAYLFARKNRTHYICSVLQRWYTNTISILTINNLPAMGANVAAGQLQNRNHDTGKKH